MCYSCCSSVYQDNKRETLNSLIRLQTPYPEREPCEEVAVRAGSCACMPLKCLEGLCMFTCGVFLWPIPCTVCKIETEHSGTNVSVKSIYPALRMTHLPCHYRDDYYTESMKGPTGPSIIHTRTDETRIPCNTDMKKPYGSLEAVRAKSTLTGFNCAFTGVGKMAKAAMAVLCCPAMSIDIGCYGNK